MRCFRRVVVSIVIVIASIWMSLSVHAQGLPPSVDLAVPRAGICLMALRDGSATYRSWAVVQNPAAVAVRTRVRFWAYLVGPGMRIGLYGGSPYVDMTVQVSPASSRYVARVDTFRWPGTVALYRNYVQAVDFSAGVLNTGNDPNPGNDSVRAYVSAYQWCPGYEPRAFGIVFRDNNRNGRQDPGETGIAGVIIELWQGGRKVTAVTSRRDGSWSIAVSTPGNYHISAIVPRSVRNLLGGAISWTTPSRYYNVPVTGGGTGPYRFGLAGMPPPPPAQKPIGPRPEASIGWGAAVTRPVVVGQDPDRRGADVFVTIRSYPVTYIWYEFNTRTGRWEERRAAVTDYVDLDSVRLTATLRRESRDWIRNELAAKYPGARVRRPFWNLQLQPTYRVVRDEVLPDGTHEVEIAVTRIPFEDPGVYAVRATARTRGTTWPGSRVTDPALVVPPAETSTRSVDIVAGATLKVWLLDTRLAY